MMSVEKPKTILFVGNFSLPDKNAAAVRIKAVQESLQLSDTNVYRSSSIISLFVSVKMVLKASSYPKVVWLYNPNILTVLLFNSLKLLANVKVVLDITEKLDNRPYNLRGVVKFLSGMLIKKTLGLNDGIVVSSKYSSSIHQHKNMLILPTFLPAGSFKSKKEIKYTDTKTIIYFGNPFLVTRSFLFKKKVYVKEKLDILVHEFVKTPDPEWKLVILGVSKSQFLEAYPEFKLLLPKIYRVKFLGRVSRDEALDRVAQATFSYCLRASSEGMNMGFPTKVFESIAVGTPVIANNTSDIFEYLRNNENSVLLEEADLTPSLSLFDYLDNFLSVRSDEIPVPDECRPPFWTKKLMKFIDGV